MYVCIYLFVYLYIYSILEQKKQRCWWLPSSTMALHRFHLRTSPRKNVVRAANMFSVRLKRDAIFVPWAFQCIK